MYWDALIIMCGEGHNMKLVGMPRYQNMKLPS